jgi:hypothetical protein
MDTHLQEMAELAAGCSASTMSRLRRKAEEDPGHRISAAEQGGQERHDVDSAWIHFLKRHYRTSQ